MTIETTCPDCRGRGHFSVVEGDIFKGYEECTKCLGNGWICIIIPDEDTQDILTQLFEQKHELIIKYL